MRGSFLHVLFVDYRRSVCELGRKMVKAKRCLLGYHLGLVYNSNYGIFLLLGVFESLACFRLVTGCLSVPTRKGSSYECQED